MDDQKQRAMALDPQYSFIVQAPAGSGKTGLLVQRFLSLLAFAVNTPESCLAITFTRKAAAEMRERILAALTRAKDPTPPVVPYERQTWELARLVLAKDTAKDWHLELNPKRLRIQTIDALSMSIVKQLPVISQFGATPKITEDAMPLYLTAAQNLLDDLEKDRLWSNSLRLLLAHLDNNMSLAQRLLAEMLPNRDQWLPHLGRTLSTTEVRKSLETGLQAVIEELLVSLVAVLPSNFHEILKIAEWAAAQLAILNPESKIGECLRKVGSIPGTTVSDLKFWQGLGALLLTQDLDYRKTVTEAQGFPSPSTALHKEDKVIFRMMKTRMKEILEALSKNLAFKDLLGRIYQCPDPVYSETQWKVLEGLMQLLPVLVAQLAVVFQEEGVVDFTEVSLRALNALGDTEAPTDLAMQLDYKIQHLLVDEFQDTSIPQFRLLEQLTAAWQPGEGRTLFLVGDPMQSIYRFRQAEVGLFIRAKLKGIQGIPLQSITLTTNFRSEAPIINWVNESFKKIFPQKDDIVSGAISYSPSVPKLGSDSELKAKVEVIPVTIDSEAKQIIEIIQQLKTENTSQSIAILVRSRTHLQNLLPQLRVSNIAYQGVQLATLSERPIVLDLLSLTRALLHLGDRVAWLALLRTPFISLSLNTLLEIANLAKETTIWDGLLRISETQDLNCVPILKKAIQQRGRLPLREWVTETWISLGGPHFFYEEGDINEAEAFLNILEEKQYDYTKEGVLERRLQTLFAKPNIVDPFAIQVMTIHRAKGLEFDVVIVPGIGRKTPSPVKKLLLWAERARSFEESYLLLAPLQSVGSPPDLLYSFLKRQDDERAVHESNRLWYVAATRAKKRLYWLTHGAEESAVEDIVTEN
jgi:ATP-dependent helicase/nuclease subunit A